MSDIPAAYKGEMLFIGYSDTSRNGVRITFALPDRESLEPFVTAKAGKRYMAVLVELGDDENPVPQEKKRERLGPLCEWAVKRCKESLFWEFLNNDPAFSGSDEVTNEEEAKEEILFLCSINSRKELDTDASAGQWFKRNIMEHYGEWLQRREVTA